MENNSSTPLGNYKKNQYLCQRIETTYSSQKLGVLQNGVFKDKLKWSDNFSKKIYMYLNKQIILKETLCQNRAWKSICSNKSYFKGDLICTCTP